MTDTSSPDESGFPEYTDEFRETLKEYPGYESSDDRRVSDESIRAYLSRTITEFLRHIASLETHLATRQPEVLARRARQAEAGLEMLQDKLQMTPYSYSLFFTANRLSRVLVETVVAYDRDILAECGAVRDFLGPALVEDTDFEALLNKISEIVGKLENHVEERMSAIMEFQ